MPSTNRKSSQLTENANSQFLFRFCLENRDSHERCCGGLIFNGFTYEKIGEILWIDWDIFTFQHTPQNLDIHDFWNYRNLQPSFFTSITLHFVQGPPTHNPPFCPGPPRPPIEHAHLRACLMVGTVKIIKCACKIITIRPQSRLSRFSVLGSDCL